VQGGVRAVEIVVMKEAREELSAVVGGVVSTGISPFAGEGLDEAFGLAVGLRAIGAGEEMFEAQLAAGGGEAFGAVSGAAVGEDGLDGDAMILVEGDGLVECVQDTGRFLIGKKAGKGQA